MSFILSLALLGAASAAEPAEPQPKEHQGFYLRIGGGPFQPEAGTIRNDTLRDAVETARLRLEDRAYDGFRDSLNAGLDSLVEDADGEAMFADTGFAVSLAVGLKIFRGLYADFDVVGQTIDLQGIEGIPDLRFDGSEADFSSTSVLGGLVYHLPVGPAHLYAGGGYGYSGNNLEITTSIGGSETGSDGLAGAATYQFKAGADFKVGRTSRVGFEGRYLETDGFPFDFNDYTYTIEYGMRAIFVTYRIEG